VYEENRNDGRRGDWVNGIMEWWKIGIMG